MKIAIFTDSFLPQIDGVVTFIMSFSKALAKKGHKVYVIAPKSKAKEEFSYPGVKVIRVSSIPAFYYKGYRLTSLFNESLFRYLKKERIDIIHFQTPVTLGMEAIIFSKLLKVPLVGTFHTFFTHPLYVKHLKLNGRVIHNLSWPYARMFYNKCNLITCPSEQTRKELLSKGFHNPIKVISNGIDAEGFDNSNWQEVKRKYNPDGKLLFFIGRIAYEKNIFYLLRCFKLVLEKLPKTRLLIVGDGPQMSELKSEIKLLGLSKNIILAGQIEHEILKKSSIFKACDLFVTASTTETQGISTMEAQANGLVCIGVDVLGTKSLIKDGYNGYLVRYGDKKEFAAKVISLLLNKSLYDKMKRNTLKEIRKHNLKNIIKIWEDEYSRLIDSYQKLGFKELLHVNLKKALSHVKNLSLKNFYLS